MLKLWDRTKLVVLVPIVWPFCLAQCLLGLPQDMGIVNDQIRYTWRNAGKR